MTIELDELERLAKAAPSGQWEVWTSNSWRRVYANQGLEQVRVIEPVVQRSDNHPDLWFGQGVAEYLEGVTPETVLALIAEVRALQTDLSSIERFAKNLREREDLCAIGGIHIHEHIKHLKLAREKS